MKTKSVTFDMKCLGDGVCRLYTLQAEFSDVRDLCLQGIGCNSQQKPKVLTFI